MMTNLSFPTWLMVLAMVSPLAAQSDPDSAGRGEPSSSIVPDDVDIDRLQSENELRYHNIAQPLGCLLESREESLERRLERIERLLASPEVQSALAEAKRPSPPVDASVKQPTESVETMPASPLTETRAETRAEIELMAATQSTPRDELAMEPAVAESALENTATAANTPAVVLASAEVESPDAASNGRECLESELWQAVCDLEQACTRLRGILEAMPLEVK